MTDWIPVASIADLRRRKRLKVSAGDHDVALFLIDDHVYALEDVCVHKQRSLSKGTVLHGRVICPGHQWIFDPATGQVEDQQQCQPTYEVRVVDEQIFVDPRPRNSAAEVADAADITAVAESSHGRL